MKNNNFGNPVFNKREGLNLMTYFPKEWNIQLILAKVYLETSETRTSISLFEVIKPPLMQPHQFIKFE